MSTLGSTLTALYHQYPSLPKRDIQELVAFVLDRRYTDLFLSLDHMLDRQAITKIDELVGQRGTGRPLAYIIGHVDFYGCRLFVNDHVLIPRLETELLLDLLKKEISNRTVHTVFDVCAGSGCLGICFKKYKPQCEVYLSDISEEAVVLAKRNAIENHVEVTCLLGDLMKPFQGLKKTDLVLCNPPYISDAEFAGLEPSVRDFEPRRALTSGPSGLEIFQRLSNTLPEHMNHGALLALEIGYMQKESINKIFSKYPWRNFRCYQDYAGLDRFIFLEVE